MVETCRRIIELLFVVAMADLNCVASILLWQTSMRVLMWDAHIFIIYCVFDTEAAYLNLSSCDTVIINDI